MVGTALGATYIVNDQDGGVLSDMAVEHTLTHAGLQFVGGRYRGISVIHVNCAHKISNGEVYNPYIKSGRPPVITAIIGKFQYYNKWVGTDLECVCQNNNITHEQKYFLV